jgi:hypothetical protein
VLSSSSFYFSLLSPSKSSPHYGSEFRIELVDAATDSTVGTGLVTTQMLLQQQRDFLIEHERFSMMGLLLSGTKFRGKRRIRLGLRHGMKDLPSSDFFLPTNPSALVSSKPSQGDIVAFAEILIGLEEDFESLYGSNPYECPSAPVELGMNMFQVHLRRLMALIDDARAALATYLYLVSWKNPLLTVLSFVLFVFACTNFDPCYFGSLPTFFVVVLMICLGIRRFFGVGKDRFFRKETDALKKVKSNILGRLSALDNLFLTITEAG